MTQINYRLFLLEENGNYAELETDGLDFTTTFTVSELSDISQRKDRLSKNIVLKGTKKNNRIFGSLFSLSRYSDTTLTEKLYANYSPNRSVDCLVYENSTLLFKGGLKVIEIDKDLYGNLTYEAVITGYFITFFGKIGNDQLTDIADEFGDSHTYSLAAIQNSWDIFFTNHFIYPNIDYGSGIIQDITKFDLRNFRCGIYLKYYFDCIFSHYGYSYSGDFINSDIFSHAFIPYAEKEFTRYITEPLFTATGTASYVWTTTASRSVGFKGLSFSNVPANSYVYDAPGTINGGRWGGSGQSFYFNRNVTTDGIVKIDFNAHLITTHATNIGVGIYPMGGTNSSISGPPPYTYKSYPVSGANPDVTDSIEWKLPFQSYAKDTGYAVFFWISNSDSFDTTTGQVRVDVTNASFQYGNDLEQSQVEILIGDNLYVKDVLPQNIKIVDFLKSTLQLFNLYLSQDPDNDKNVIIEPYDVFYSKFLYPSPYAVDWSNKIDYTNGWKMLINTELPKEYDFKFKEDGDYYNDLYKKKYNDTYGNFSITNSKGTADASSITTTFSPTVVVQENLDDKIMPAIYGGDVSKKTTFKSNLRVLFNNGVRDCASYSVVLMATASVGFTYSTVQSAMIQYCQAHHILNPTGSNIFNLQYGIPNEVYAPVTQDIFTIPYIYSQFYENQLDELNDDNIYTFQCNVLLDETDISNIDFRVPVYIQNSDGGSYYKINAIDYYNSGELSSVTLQKAILQSPIGPGPDTAGATGATGMGATVGNIYWNFATIGDDYFPTVMTFDIYKNGTQSVHSATATGGNYQYNYPIENWHKFGATAGDEIVVKVNCVHSGSDGNTIGSTSVTQTTQNTGYPYYIGTTLYSESVGPTGGVLNIFTFSVAPDMNYAISTIYFQ